MSMSMSMSMSISYSYPFDKNINDCDNGIDVAPSATSCKDKTDVGHVEMKARPVRNDVSVGS